MAERLFDVDHVSGMKTWFSSDDENGGTWRFRYEQDTSPILDENKEMQSQRVDRRSELWHAAKIPAVVQMEWLTKHGIDLYNPNHKEGVRRLLNSSDYRHLRRQPFTL